MLGLTIMTVPQAVDPTDRRNPDAVRRRSLEAMRTAIGIVGCLLPTAMLIGEAAVVRGSLHFRGSLSAYYHSAMRDMFVGFLYIIGFLLILYLWGNFRSWDFVLSSLAGLAALGVANIPTSRPGQHSPPACDHVTSPIVTSCTPLQVRLGENTAQIIHGVCATSFIALLIPISALFAYRAWRFDKQRNMAVIHLICTVIIASAAAWALFGLKLNGGDIGELTAVYVGEVVAVYGFSISWLANGTSLRPWLARRPLKGLKNDETPSGLST